MGEFLRFVIRFFHGWRRKVGVVTLFLALVFMGWWVSSFYVPQTIPLSSNEYGFTQLISFDGTINWDWAGREPIVFRDTLKLHNQIKSLLASERASNSELKMRKVGRHQFRRDDISMTIWIIPYWSIVPPLTALSAFLLLCKPRKAIQKKTPESVPAEGA